MAELSLKHQPASLDAEGKIVYGKRAEVVICSRSDACRVQSHGREPASQSIGTAEPHGSHLAGCNAPVWESWQAAFAWPAFRRVAPGRAAKRRN